MANCLCGSWRRTSFGLVCRQCGKHKQVKEEDQKNSSQSLSFDAILHQIQSEYNKNDGDPKDHCQVLSYEMVNGEIIVTGIVYDEDKDKDKKFPKSITTWKY